MDMDGSLGNTLDIEFPMLGKSPKVLFASSQIQDIDMENFWHLGQRLQDRQRLQLRRSTKET